MRACSEPSCRSPTALHAQVRWVAGELCAAAGLQVADGAPALPLDPPGISPAAAAARLAREEELDGPVDEHGRFPASASALAAGAAPLDDRGAMREAATAVGATPAPAYPGGARLRWR